MSSMNLHTDMNKVYCQAGQAEMIINRIPTDEWNKESVTKILRRYSYPVLRNLSNHWVRSDLPAFGIRRIPSTYWMSGTLYGAGKQFKEWVDEALEEEKPRWIKNLVAEFWNAREAWLYASKHGYTKDIEKTGKRAHKAQWELECLGFFKERVKIPTLDELEEGAC